jgi:hypothetical protein
MFSVDGRLYHPAPGIGHCDHALLSNSLTLQLMSVSSRACMQRFPFAQTLAFLASCCCAHVFALYRENHLQFAVAQTERGIELNLPMHDPIVIEEKQS